MEKTIDDFDNKCNINEKNISDNKPKYKSKLNRFIELSEFDVNKPTEIKIVHKNKFIEKYSDLNFKNGGDWCRRSSCDISIYKLATMKVNRTINYLWNQTDEEEDLVKNEFKKLRTKKKTPQ